MKRILTLTLALICVTTLFGQGADDACVFSQNYYQGTAKALGMGNALGAAGGDMTAVCINPAGMGLYRSNEFTTTLNLLDNYHSSTYYDSQNAGNKTRLSIPNVGYVSYNERSNYKPLRATQFGIGLTRTDDYNMRTRARGLNPTSSKIDNYLSQVNGYSEDDLADCFPYDIYPAWQTYLIDLDQEGYYTSPVPQGNIFQGQKNNFKGRSEEWTFAGSANYRDRLFLGASLNITHIKRVGTRVFNEASPEGADPETGFNDWSFSEDLSSTGWGCNAKVGFIFHMTPWMRIGGAFHTPSIYAFEETWQTETESEIGYVTRKYISQESHYEYTFIKPLRWVGSMAFIIGQQGMVSLDAEYTNSGAARFNAAADDDYDYTPTNNEIEKKYGRTLNFRLGTEWYLGGSYVRFGAGYYGSPTRFGETSGSIKKASCGISVPVADDTFFDFAYELTYGRSYLYLYDAGELDIEPVDQKLFKSNLAVTLKAKF